MRVEEQPAYILHQRPFRDTSQILEIFSKEYGRLSLVSKGSRAPKSRLRSILQPFRPLLLSWSGRGEMPGLTKAEPASQSVNFFQGKSLACAMYINELMMYLTYRHDAHSDLFSQYHETINRLGDQNALEKELRLFELNLLENLGLAVNLSVDVSTQHVVSPGQGYIYLQEQGMSSFTGSKPRGAPVISGETLLALAQRELEDETVLKESKHLMRYILSFQLGGKTLKSRELFR